jgi:VWFA-related protein
MGLIDEGSNVTGRRKVTALWRLALCLTVLGAGSPDDGHPGPECVAQFKTRAEAVRVDVLVTQRGRPVRGLTAQDFELRDEGVLQQIELVDDRAEPITVLCLIDTGDNLQANSRFENLTDAASALVDGLQPGDRIALVGFSNRIHVLSTPTTDRESVKSALGLLRPGGVSSLRDALFAALVLRQLDSGRTLLVVFSHGWTGLGYVRRPQLLDAARRTDAVVYAVTYEYRDAAPMDYGPFLDALAQETGGRVLIAKEDRDLTGVFVNILAEFRSRYVLAYVPTGVAPGGWHRLEVRLKGRPGDVKARRGYFAE